MPSLIFNSALRDEAVGAIDYDSDTFRLMLVTSSYAPNKDTHTKRSNVTNEVVGAGYTAGGAVCAVTVDAVDTANDRVVINFGAVSFPNATITARGAVIYKARCGAAAADELFAYIDFVTDFVSTNGTFQVGASTITKQN